MFLSIAFLLISFPAETFVLVTSRAKREHEHELIVWVAAAACPAVDPIGLSMIADGHDAFRDATE